MIIFTLFYILQSVGGIHFEATISLGNVLTFLAFALAAIKFWSAQIEYKKDMEWRVNNLEIWRKEHMFDADARDQILSNSNKVLERLEWVEDARQKAANSLPGKRRLGDP
jgi:hypothetical protein